MACLLAQAQDPVELVLAIAVLAAAQRVCHALQSIHKRAGQVIGGVRLRRNAVLLCRNLSDAHEHRAASFAWSAWLGYVTRFTLETMLRVQG